MLDIQTGEEEETNWEQSSCSRDFIKKMDLMSLKQVLFFLWTHIVGLIMLGDCEHPVRAAHDHLDELIFMWHIIRRIIMWQYHELIPPNTNLWQ